MFCLAQSHLHSRCRGRTCVPCRSRLRQTPCPRHTVAQRRCAPCRTPCPTRLPLCSRCRGGTCVLGTKIARCLQMPGRGAGLRLVKALPHHAPAMLRVGEDGLLDLFACLVGAQVSRVSHPRRGRGMGPVIAGWARGLTPADIVGRAAQRYRHTRRDSGSRAVAVNCRRPCTVVDCRRAAAAAAAAASQRCRPVGAAFRADHPGDVETGGTLAHAAQLLHVDLDDPASPGGLVQLNPVPHPARAVVLACGNTGGVGISGSSTLACHAPDLIWLFDQMPGWHPHCGWCAADAAARLGWRARHQ